MAPSSCHTPSAGRPAEGVRVAGPAGTSEVRLTHGSGGRALIFFEGDQIADDDTRDLLGPERWSPEAHLTALSSRVGADTSVLLVMPSTVVAGGQACYGNFLASMTATGEPLGFRPRGYPAASHLTAILSATDPDHDRDGGGGGEGCDGGGGGAGGVADMALVGFSKGAVVLNQLLAEMAWREEALEAGPHQPAPASVQAAVQAGAAAAGPTERVPDPPPRPRPPSGANPPEPPHDSVAALLDSIHVVHFLDAGLNCRGVHLTDPAVTALLGRRHRRRPLVVHLHGTPRQWGDRRRPWIAAERDRFLGLLREAGVPTHVHPYFEGQPPSLRQHFDIITHMQAVA